MSTTFHNFNHLFPFFPLNEPPSTFSWISSTLLVTLLACGVFRVLKPDPYAHIPAVGGAGTLSAYMTVRKFYRNFSDLLVTGYDKYEGRIYRIPDVDFWRIIVSQPDQIEELRKAPSNVLSPRAFVDAIFFFSYLMDPTLMSNTYHVEILRSQLYKNLGAVFDDLRDEIHVALGDNIPQSDDWTSIHVYPMVTGVIARAVHRIFVGLPVCREPEYLKTNIDFIENMGICRPILVCTPVFMRLLVSRLLSPFSKSVAVVAKYLGPIIKERQNKIDEYGRDYPGKPLDALSWLMDSAVGGERNIANLAKRVLGLNFAAVGTMSLSFTNALYDLAAEPHYLKPLREEIESVIAEEGWTKVATTKMHILDSFLKESMRMNMVDLTSFSRMALKEFTFSDGTFIPKGCVISVAMSSIHHDEERYSDSKKFDGFRFVKKRAQEGNRITNNQLAITSPDFVPFGHGKHACPGRFLAEIVLKIMMAYIILNYDIKLENEGVRPKSFSMATLCVPDLTAKVMFRRRQ